MSGQRRRFTVPRSHAVAMDHARRPAPPTRYALGQHGLVGLVGSAGVVAEQGYRACMKGQVICVPGAVNQATTLAARATPKWLLRRVSGVVVRSLKTPR